MPSDTRGATLGLFLGKESVVAVFVRTDHGRTRITASAQITTPSGSMTEGAVMDPVRLGHAIRILLKGMKAHPSSAYVAVSPEVCGMRAFRLPEAPVRERRALVRGELETVEALRLGAGAFDFLWSEAPSDNAAKQADVFAFYCDDPVVDSIRETLDVAGLRLEAIEPYSIAVIRAYLAMHSAERPVGLLCPSANHSDLCILDGKQARYLRRIVGGWDEIRNLRPTGADHRPAPPQGQSSQLGGGEASVTESPVLTADAAVRGFLASDVARSFAFYEREYRDAPPPEELVVLTPRRFAEQVTRVFGPALSVPVSGQDVAEALNVPEEETGESGLLGYAAAAGVCMADVVTILPRVDTSRQEEAAIRRRRAPSVLLTGIAGSTVWMILSLVAMFVLMYLQSDAQRRNTEVAAAIQKEWERHAVPMREQALFNAAREQQLRVALPGWAVLVALAEAHVDGISLTRVKIDAGSKVTIEGNALTPKSMEAFAERLARTGAVGQPTFDMMHQDRDGRFSFRILGSCAGLTPEGARRLGE